MANFDQPNSGDVTKTEAQQLADLKDCMQSNFDEAIADLDSSDMFNPKTILDVAQEVAIKNETECDFPSAEARMRAYSQTHSDVLDTAVSLSALNSSMKGERDFE